MKKIQDNFNGLDFDKIIRRGDRDISSASKIPTELFQIAVFYSRPVVEELDFWDDKEVEKRIKEVSFLDRNKAKQSLSDFKGLCNIQFENQRFIFPFYSQEVFTVQTDALNFVPNFIRKLIEEKKLPETVLNEDKSIKESIVQVGIVSLNVVFLERKDDVNFKM